MNRHGIEWPHFCRFEGLEDAVSALEQDEQDMKHLLESKETEIAFLKGNIRILEAERLSQKECRVVSVEECGIVSVDERLMPKDAEIFESEQRLLMGEALCERMGHQIEDLRARSDSAGGGRLDAGWLDVGNDAASADKVVVLMPFCDGLFVP